MKLFNFGEFDEINQKKYQDISPDDFLLSFVKNKETIYSLKVQKEELKRLILRLQNYKEGLIKTIAEAIRVGTAKVEDRELIDVAYCCGDENLITRHVALDNFIKFPKGILVSYQFSEAYDRIDTEIPELEEHLKSLYNQLLSFAEHQTYAIFEKGIVIYVRDEDGLIVSDKEIESDSLPLEKAVSSLIAEHGLEKVVNAVNSKRYKEVKE